MMHEEISQNLADRNMRIDRIHHLGGMCHDHSWPDEVKDDFEMWPEEVGAALGFDPDDGLYPLEEEEVFETLRLTGLLGFLIWFATPVPMFHSKDSYSSSWGHYAHKWVYGETLEEAVRKGMEWRDGYIEGERARQLGAGD